MGKGDINAICSKNVFMLRNGAEEVTPTAKTYKQVTSKRHNLEGSAWYLHKRGGDIDTPKV
jgi:hypothetical protein